MHNWKIVGLLSPLYTNIFPSPSQTLGGIGGSREFLLKSG